MRKYKEFNAAALGDTARVISCANVVLQAAGQTLNSIWRSWYAANNLTTISEIRYVLPMHGVLIVFAGVGIERFFPQRRQDAKKDAKGSDLSFAALRENDSTLINSDVKSIANPLPREMMEHTYPILFRSERCSFGFRDAGSRHDYLVNPTIMRRTVIIES